MAEHRGGGASRGAGQEQSPRGRWGRSPFRSHCLMPSQESRREALGPGEPHGGWASIVWQPLRSARGKWPVPWVLLGDRPGRAARAVPGVKEGLLLPRPLRLALGGMGPPPLLLWALSALLCAAVAGEARGARSCAETRQALASRGFSLASVPPTLISGKGARAESCSEGAAAKVSCPAGGGVGEQRRLERRETPPVPLQERQVGQSLAKGNPPARSPPFPLLRSDGLWARGKSCEGRRSPLLGHLPSHHHPPEGSGEEEGKGLVGKTFAQGGG